MAAVEGWLAAGITRVILGTAALTNPQFVKDAARAFLNRIVVGADAKGGKGFDVVFALNALAWSLMVNVRFPNATTSTLHPQY